MEILIEEKGTGASWGLRITSQKGHLNLSHVVYKRNLIQFWQLLQNATEQYLLVIERHMTLFTTVSFTANWFVLDISSKTHRVDNWNEVSIKSHHGSWSVFKGESIEMFKRRTRKKPILSNQYEEHLRGAFGVCLWAYNIPILLELVQ